MRRAGPSTLASAALVNLAVAHWRPRRPPSSMSELHNSPEPTAYNYRVVRQFTLTPRLRGHEQMHSFGLINAPFWLATIGTVLYIASMWVNGITQGLMWRAINEDGTLTYSFVEALQASHPGYVVRMAGGGIFASGMLLMALNTWLTVRRRRDERAPQASPLLAS
ncbi:cbb3-type cytochrome c oxidase subunit I [Streptococcus pneumoniae]|nr:cbb3-type cytochrome c oxidase subunit I [Streptococcus pneumoniae]